MRARKPSDPASGRSSSRLGLAVLLATVAAFLLVPVAQAAAAGVLKINVVGTGEGEISKLEGYNGNEFSCSYAAPGPATGECEPEMKKNGGGKDEQATLPVPAAGSETASVTLERGGDVLAEEFAPEYGCGNPEGRAEIEEFFGGWACVVEGEAEEKGGEITVCFAKEGEGEKGCPTEEEEPNLKVEIESGEGTVVSNPAGISCKPTCSAKFKVGEKVVLTASPAPGYLFKSWKKCDIGGANGRQCTVTITEGLKVVGANFYNVFSLKASKTGGIGIMGTAPGGIVCGYACTSSTALYKEGALTVKAKPAKHFEFVEFKGGTGSASVCNGSKSLECTIATFNSNSTIEEVYAEEKKNTLSVSKEGGGQGFVKTTPSNINCGYTCTAAAAQFYASETAAITVTLNKGTTSVTWTTSAGTCTGKVLTCSVPMSASKTLVAKFD